VASTGRVLPWFWKLLPLGLGLLDWEWEVQVSISSCSPGTLASPGFTFWPFRAPPEDVGQWWGVAVAELPGVLRMPQEGLGVTFPSVSPEGGADSPFCLRHTGCAGQALPACLSSLLLSLASCFLPCAFLLVQFGLCLEFWPLTESLSGLCFLAAAQLCRIAR
jgi:hypothetical protein